ncbi:hypothetical protein CKO27_05780 [Thiocystis violacea]|nr:hypothetical protein [Thiocystis violacea]
MTHEREKLINAIVYFARNTRYLGKIKLFKLLYLLDFEHFRQTGQNVTGLAYSAWKYGPVPVALAQEWEELESDLAAAIAIRPQQVVDYERQAVIALTEFDDSHFSRRELRIMAELVNKYGEEYSPKMIDVTHAENGAWAKVWNDGEGFNQRISYDLALADDETHRDAILEAAEEYQAIVNSARG